MLWTDSRQNEKNVFRHRALLLFGAILYALWWFVFDNASPDAIDPIAGRLIISGLLVGVFILSFVSTFVLRNLDHAVLIVGIAATTHYFYLMHLNPTDMNYVAASFVMVFTVSTCFVTRWQVLSYIVTTVFLGMILSLIHPELPHIIFWAGITTGLVITLAAAFMRLKLVESLLSTEERFRLLTDHAPVMIWLTDERGGCFYFNEVWLKFTGLKSNEASGNGWTQTIHPDDRNAYLEKYFSAFRTRGRFFTSCRMKRSDNEYHSVFVQATPLYRPNGIFEGFVGSSIEITDAVLPAPARVTPTVHHS